MSCVSEPLWLLPERILPLTPLVCIELIKPANTHTSKATHMIYPAHFKMKLLEPGINDGAYIEGCQHFLNHNYADAIESFKKSTSSGSSRSRYNLFVMTFLGFGMGPDFNNAYMWCKLAADEGLADAAISLAAMHLCGAGTDLDINAATDLLERAATAENVQAAYLFALIHIETQEDLQPAVNWLRFGITRKHAASIFFMGYLYATGLGVDRDDAVAIALFEDAAALGHAAAQINRDRLAAIKKKSIATPTDLITPEGLTPIDIQSNLLHTDTVRYLLQKHVSAGGFFKYSVSFVQRHLRMDYLPAAAALVALYKAGAFTLPLDDQNTRRLLDC